MLKSSFYFKGVVILARSSGDLFVVLTEEEPEGINEVFVGSFSMRQVFKKWSVGQKGSAGPARINWLSLNEDGSNLAASMVPPVIESRPPRGFLNLRVFNTRTGETLKSARADAPFGHVELLPDDDVLASRLLAPGIFFEEGVPREMEPELGKARWAIL